MGTRSLTLMFMIAAEREYFPLGHRRWRGTLPTHERGGRLADMPGKDAHGF